MAERVTELRTDFTGDSDDLTKAAKQATEALDAVADATEDMGDEAVLTEKHFDALADELAAMVRKAERAETQTRDLRRELRNLKDAADDLDGKHVDIDVDIDKEGRLSRMVGTITTLAAEAGGAFLRLPWQAQVAVAGVVSAVAAVTGAVAAVEAAGLAAGGVLAGIAMWLYNRDPTSPMSQAINDVRAQFDTLATTLANVLQPVMDNIALVVGPQVEDLLRRLKDWVVNNDEQIQQWAEDFAKAFLSAVEFAALFASALLGIVKKVIPPLIAGFGEIAKWIGHVLRAMGFFSPEAKAAGDALIRAGGDAQTMAHDLGEMADLGSQAMAEISAAAGGARTELQLLDEQDVTVEAKRDQKSWADLMIAKQEAAKAVVVPVSWNLGKLSQPLIDALGIGGRASASSRSVPAPGAYGAPQSTGPVYNVTVSGALDPDAVARQIERVLAGQDARMRGRPAWAGT